MSVIDSSSPQGTPDVPEPQDEQLPVTKIVVIGTLSLGLFAIGVVWSTLILNQTQEEVTREAGAWKRPSEVGKAEVGMVDQQLFSEEKRATQLRQDKQTRLDGAGWASQRDQLVYIPIEDAMRAVARGQRPGAVAPPAPEPVLINSGTKRGVLPAPGPAAPGPGSGAHGP